MRGENMVCLCEPKINGVINAKTKLLCGAVNSTLVSIHTSVGLIKKLEER